MKSIKSLLVLLPLGYLLLAYLLFKEGWIVASLIMLFFSVAFGLLVIGVNAQRD